MSRTQAELKPLTVVKGKKVLAESMVPTCPLPQAQGLKVGHEKLLGSYFLHLLLYYSLYLFHYPESQREVGIDSPGYRVYHSGADKKLVTYGLCLFWVLSPGVKESLR